MVRFTVTSALSVLLLGKRAVADGIPIPLHQQTPSPLGLDPFNPDVFSHYIAQFEGRISTLLDSLGSQIASNFGLGFKSIGDGLASDDGQPPSDGLVKRRRKKAHRKHAKHSPPAAPGIVAKERATTKTSGSLSDFSTMWTGNIEIGTPQASFRVDFDTGSADLFVPSSQCNVSACAVKNKYNPSNSTSSVATGQDFSIRYADGSNTTGPVYRDTVTFSDVAVKNQTFAATTSLSQSFASDPIDGIVGLGFQANSNLKELPFVQNAFAQGAIAAQKFGFYLARDGSELTLGGSNDNLYTGEPESHKVINSKIWQIGNGKVYVGSTSIVNIPLVTSLDTGTSLMFGPASHVAALWAQVPGATLWDEKSSLWTFPCNTTARISFQWDDGNKWQVSPETLSQGATGNEGLCIGSISGHDLDLGNVWLLGDAFLRNVYSIFDFDDGGTIAFAPLRNSSS